MYSFQKEWFLELYGFDSEESLKQFLSSKNTIIDTGCGLGYKAAWFAELAPHALVVGVDISEAAKIAAKANVGGLILGHYSTRYGDQNLFKEEAQVFFDNVYLSEDGKLFDI